MYHRTVTSSLLSFKLVSPDLQATEDQSEMWFTEGIELTVYGLHSLPLENFFKDFIF